MSNLGLAEDCAAAAAPVVAATTPTSSPSTTNRSISCHDSNPEIQQNSASYGVPSSPRRTTRTIDVEADATAVDHDDSPVFPSRSQQQSYSFNVLNRHYSTIGIDDVFLEPPPHPYVSSYLSSSSAAAAASSSSAISSSFWSWEIVGTIKSIPEDFVVRERLDCKKLKQSWIGPIARFPTFQEKREQNLLQDNEQEQQQEDQSCTASFLESNSYDGVSTPWINSQSHHLSSSDKKDPPLTATPATWSTITTRRPAITENSFLDTESGILGNETNKRKEKECFDISMQEREDTVTATTVCTTNGTSAIRSSTCNDAIIRDYLQRVCASPNSPQDYYHSTVSNPCTYQESLNTLNGHAMSKIQQLAKCHSFFHETTDTPNTMMATTSTTKHTFLNSKNQLDNDDNGDEKNPCGSMELPKACNKSTGSDNKQDDERHEVWIPVPQQHSNATQLLEHDNNHEQEAGCRNDRGAFHRALKVEYPLLQSETVTATSSLQRTSEIPITTTTTTSKIHATNSTIQPTALWIRVSIDPTFYDLIPVLYDAKCDLPCLYRFRNRGAHFAKLSIQERRQRQQQEQSPSMSDSKVLLSKYVKSSHGKRGRRRRGQHHEQGRGSQDLETTTILLSSSMVPEMNDMNHSQVFLRLHPNISKEQRRSIHQLIQTNCKSFITSTIPNVPLVTVEEDKSGQLLRGENDKLEESLQEPASVTVIIVRWSNQALGRKRGSSWTLHNDQTQKKRRKCHSEGNKINPSAIQEGQEQSRRQRQHQNILCVLKKRQMEHLTAIRQLVSILKCREAEIGLAGIKDMQAVTYQFCTIQNMRLERVERETCRLRGYNSISAESNIQSTATHKISKALEIETLGKVDWMLTSGDLDGNQFEIVVRDLHRIYVSTSSTGKDDPSATQEGRHLMTASPRTANSTLSEAISRGVSENLVPWCDVAHIRSMVHRIQQFGFINFFGEQRIGAAGLAEDVGVRPFDIGKAMLQQNLSLAIHYILVGRKVTDISNLDASDCTVTSSESLKVQAVRDTWISTGGDVKETLKTLTRSAGKGKGHIFMPREYSVLAGLKRYGKNRPLEALRCLPYNIRVFYIHAYQSYVWNVVASARIKLYGTCVKVGDLYQEDNHNRQDAKGKDDDNSSVKINLRTETVRLVDTKELARNLTLDQVVLPLPGYNVQYPTNEIGDVYKQVLQQDAIDFSKKLPPEGTAKGSYRRLIEHSRNLEVHLFNDEDGTKQALDDAKAEDKTRSIKLSFGLRKGSYATMLLREFMLTTSTRPNRTLSTQIDIGKTKMRENHTIP